MEYLDNDYPFEPTPSDTEIFLSDEPMNLIKQHILDQFRKPLDYRFDYVGSYIEQYKFSFLDVMHDDESDALDMLNDDFIQFMLNVFSEKLGIGFPDFETKGMDEQHDLLHMTYRYFIVNIKHNFASFCYNYIMKHKAELAESLPKRKDVTSLNLKKDEFDPDDITIITNLYDVIKRCLYETDHDVDEFLNNSDIDEPRLETDLVRDWYEDFSITGNFYEKYRNMLDDYFIKEIENKIRNRIFKSYKNREKED